MNEDIEIVTREFTSRRSFPRKIISDERCSSKEIVVEGACHHNLKNINITLPKNKLIVFTGVSGSGKSTLVFDTIYAEAQRRFVDGLSSTSKRHFEKVGKPSVDKIYGLSPAIAIEQKSLGNNPRSTVGTLTEISDYLRILYEKIGIPYCLNCGTSIYKQTPREIAESICKKFSAGESFNIYAPLLTQKTNDINSSIRELFQGGFRKLRLDSNIIDLTEETRISQTGNLSIDVISKEFFLPNVLGKENNTEFIDRVTVEIRNLLLYTKGTLEIVSSSGKILYYSAGQICARCHTVFPEITIQHFSYNTPIGMCPDCRGLGVEQEISPLLLIEDENVSILDGALKWFGNLRDGKKSTWPTGPLDILFEHYNLDIETPWSKLPEWFRNIILYGSGEEKLKYRSAQGMKDNYKAVKGLVPELTRLYYDTDSEHTRKKYGDYMVSKPCKACKGTRLCPEARSIKVGNLTISEVNALSIDDAMKWILEIYNSLDKKTWELSKELLIEIYNRLSLLVDVGLNYLSLNRTAPTLSGGEGQRVRLACQLNSGIVDVLYVLDEPSTGLHPKDTKKLIQTMQRLRDLGNTVLVVEHEQDIMKNADWLVDIGPKAGNGGGYVMAEGTPDVVLADNNSLTAQYLCGKLKVGLKRVPKDVRNQGKWLILKGVKHNNLKNVTARIPIGSLTCITGVSGSGKSSLIGGVLEPLLNRRINGGLDPVGKYESLTGDEYLDKLVNVSQSPIGRRPTSNPATYTGLFDKIRKVFANTEYAKEKGFNSEYFSFNSNKGRCEICEGQGQIKIEMHFLPDVWIPCTECGGKRFKADILKAKFKDKDISEVLEMDVEKALSFFIGYKDIVGILQTLKDVGLDYIKLGQSATTLSGGEAQRVKLAKELSTKVKGSMIYILDEPTTGLHFNDIQHLLKVFQRLVDIGHTLVVIEHDLNIIKMADWVIDLGPEGGADGGEIIAQGTVEDILNNPNSYTGQALKSSINPQEGYFTGDKICL